MRPAGLPDLAEILSWIPDAVAFERWTGPHLAYPTTPERVWAEINPTPENAFALVQDNQLVGFGQVRFHYRPGALHLARIIINPWFRGQGYGRILCTRLMAAAAANHPHTPFSLNVHPQNQVAVELYRSLGFRPAAHQPRANAILMICEPGEQLLLS